MRTVLPLIVVAAEGLAVDEGERGDDDDDAGRCRSDARALSPVPLLSESRWTRTVPTSRESAQKSFGNVRFSCGYYVRKGSQPRSQQAELRARL